MWPHRHNFFPWQFSSGVLLCSALLRRLSGWIVRARIAGHIVMAFVHSYGWKQPMIARMTRGHEQP